MRYQRILMLTLLLVSLGVTAANESASVEAIEPGEVCNRFLGEDKKTQCLKILKESSADSYLSAICDKQFDEDAFFNCLKLSKSYSFDPKKIQTCASDDLEDGQRLSCLQTAGKAWQAKIETKRVPASLKRKPQRDRKNQRNSR